jgi:hypothetical protein
MGNILRSFSEILSNNGNIIDALTGSQAGDTGILGDGSSPYSNEDSKNSSQYLNKAIKLFSNNAFQTARAKSKASGEAQTEYAFLIYYEQKNDPLKISAMATGSQGGLVAGGDWDIAKNSLPKDATIIGVYHSHPLEKNFGVDNPFSDRDVENVFNGSDTVMSWEVIFKMVSFGLQMPKIEDTLV